MKFNKKSLLIISGLILFILFISFVRIDPDRPELVYTAGIAILMAFWWVTEALPIGITSLLPVLLFPAFGVLSSSDTAAAYINNIIFLYIGGFIMALAMEKWNLHRRIALFIMLKIGRKPVTLLLGFMLAGYFLSMWMSNTATAMMMVPICLSVLASLKSYYDAADIKNFGKSLFIGLAYACSIGGIATLIGTPPNLSFARIFKLTYPEAPEITFSQWFIFSLPLSIVVLGFALLILYLIYVPKKGMGAVPNTVIMDSYKKLGKISNEEKKVLTLFILMALLWVFRSPISIGNFYIPGWSLLFREPSFLNDGTVAIGIAIVLFLIPSRSGQSLMDWKTAVKLPWDIVLLFGGGFALAQAVKDTGLGLWLGQAVTENSDTTALEMVSILTAGMSLITEFTSNTATTEMVLPIVAGIASSAEIHPLWLMIPVTLAASMAFMFPIATPPNAIVFGSSPLKMVDMLKAGIFLDIIAVILIILSLYFWGQSIFDFDLSVFPEWAKK
ncbi:SLC13 family permease [Membranihabitans maritimus]|uniref:SLC13 family permease n=1 Tax=Membranihabitans maritimus TaxID=2904244 RepID=UPI001F340970|nr:SLC13 family permease [Membranihabitans maritimus]